MGPGCTRERAGAGEGGEWEQHTDEHEQEHERERKIEREEEQEKELSGTRMYMRESRSRRRR